MFVNKKSQISMILCIKSSATVKKNEQIVQSLTVKQIIL